MRLPSGYAEVEYVQSSSNSGTINTGMKFSTKSHSLEIKFQQDNISLGYPAGTDRNDAGAIWLTNKQADNKFVINVCYNSGWKETALMYQPLDTSQHTIRYEGNNDTQNYYNGTTLKGTSNISNLPAQSTDNLFIFGRLNNGGLYVGKIFYAKAWVTETNQLLFDYVPCVRVSDRKVGFYDLVSETFKTADNYTAGPYVDPWPCNVIKLNGVINDNNLNILR